MGVDAVLVRDLQVVPALDAHRVADEGLAPGRFDRVGQDAQEAGAHDAVRA